MGRSMGMFLQELHNHVLFYAVLLKYEIETRPLLDYDGVVKPCELNADIVCCLSWYSK